jgi:hypothetical protein
MASGSNEMSAPYLTPADMVLMQALDPKFKAPQTIADIQRADDRHQSYVAALAHGDTTLPNIADMRQPYATDFEDDTLDEDITRGAGAVRGGVAPLLLSLLTAFGPQIFDLAKPLVTKGIKYIVHAIRNIPKRGFNDEPDTGYLRIKGPPGTFGPDHPKATEHITSGNGMEGGNAFTSSHSIRVDKHGMPSWVYTGPANTAAMDRPIGDTRSALAGRRYDQNGRGINVATPTFVGRGVGPSMIWGHEMIPESSFPHGGANFWKDFLEVSKGLTMNALEGLPLNKELIATKYMNRLFPKSFHKFIQEAEKEGSGSGGSVGSFFKSLVMKPVEWAIRKILKTDAAHKIHGYVNKASDEMDRIAEQRGLSVGSGIPADFFAHGPDGSGMFDNLKGLVGDVLGNTVSGLSDTGINSLMGKFGNSNFMTPDVQDFLKGALGSVTGAVGQTIKDRIRKGKRASRGQEPDEDVYNPMQYAYDDIGHETPRREYYPEEEPEEPEYEEGYKREVVPRRKPTRKTRRTAPVEPEEEAPKPRVKVPVTRKKKVTRGRGAAKAFTVKIL